MARLDIKPTLPITSYSNMWNVIRKWFKMLPGGQWLLTQTSLGAQPSLGTQPCSEDPITLHSKNFQDFLQWLA